MLKNEHLVGVLSSKNKVGPRMLTQERRREIMDLVDRQGRVTIDEIRERFGVSAVTARSDLDTLSENGALVRSHGGGIRPLETGPEYPLKIRETMRREEKAHIAKAALQLIRPYQTIILGSGSTSAEFAAQLLRASPEHVTVVTYALNVAMKLAETNNVALVMIGGILRQVSNAFVGPQAEEMLLSMHADHCFVPAVGIDLDFGLTTLDILEAQLNSRMIRAAKEVTVIADSTKFGHRSLALISNWNGIHRVITDTEAPAEAVARLQARGIEVILA
jgi:DeoR family transcriptional regulator, aga operon transcriptional repressor